MKEISIKLLENGPLRLSVNGDEESYDNVLYDAKNRPIKIRKNSILCRCGKSKQQPFCDGVHRMCGFTSENTLEDEIVQKYVEEGQVDKVHKVSVVKNGPLNVVGNIALHKDDYSTNANTQKYSLCRCGASENMPFCDGIHTSLKLTKYTF